MLRSWRLVKWNYRLTAFSGDGSRLYGGRWNSPGWRLLYLSDSQALAALENIVHFKKGAVPEAYAFFPVQFDSQLVQKLAIKLPPNWATMPLVTVALGDAWLSNPKASCILSIPTSLVPDGTNYLINPAHPDFAKISIGAALPFAFDLRITPPPSPASP